MRARARACVCVWITCPCADMSAGFAAGELDVITLDDFMRYWQELVETGLSDHIGKFWFLVRRPGSDSLQPEDLRPVIKSLVDYHVDLSAFRTDSDLLEAYITTVLIGIFCSLHGQVCACVCMCAFARSPYPPQGISKISLGELKGSNLVDAFDLVSSQSTRNIRPFCVAYFDEIISRFRSLDRSGEAGSTHLVQLLCNCTPLPQALVSSGLMTSQGQET